MNFKAELRRKVALGPLVAVIMGFNSAALSFGVQQVQVIDGRMNVGAADVSEMISRISNWNGTNFIFTDISEVVFTKLPQSLNNCSIVYTLDSDLNQVTCFHLDGVDPEANAVHTFGLMGTGSQNEYISPKDLAIYSVLGSNGRLLTQHIYIADTGNRRVKRVKYSTHKYDLRGVRVPDDIEWYSSDFGSLEFVEPAGIACTDNASVSDMRVVVADRMTNDMSFFSLAGDRYQDMDFNVKDLTGGVYWNPRKVRFLKSSGGYGLAVLVEDISGNRSLAVFENGASGWVFLGAIACPGAISVGASVEMGYMALNGVGLVTQVGLDGSFLRHIDFSGYIPAGVESRGISIFRDEMVLATEYNSMQSGLMRFKIQGGPSYVSVDHYGYRTFKDPVEVEYAVGESGWYLVEARDLYPHTERYIIPGYDPIFLEPGVYGLTLASEDIPWTNRETVVAVSLVVGPGDLTILDTVNSQEFLPVYLRDIIVESPANEVPLDSTAVAQYSCFWPELAEIEFVEVWLVDKWGNLMPGPQGENSGDLAQRGHPHFEFEWPEYSGSSLEIEVGVQMKVGYKVGERSFDDWFFGPDGTPLSVTLIRDISPGPRNPDPCVAPCFASGRFANGKKIFVLNNPCFQMTEAYFSSQISSSSAGIYDLRGAKVGELEPTEDLGGYWRTTFSPAKLGLASGVYFLRLSNGEENGILKIGVIR